MRCAGLSDIDQATHLIIGEVSSGIHHTRTSCPGHATGRALFQARDRRESSTSEGTAIYASPWSGGACTVAPSLLRGRIEITLLGAQDSNLQLISFAFSDRRGRSSPDVCTLPFVISPLKSLRDSPHTPLVVRNKVSLRLILIAWCCAPALCRFAFVRRPTLLPAPWGTTTKYNSGGEGSDGLPRGEPVREVLWGLQRPEARAGPVLRGESFGQRLVRNAARLALLCEDNSSLLGYRRRK